MNFNKYLFKELLAPLLFFGLTLVIVVGWFEEGRLMGGGEEGFSIFNQIDVLSQINLWQEVGTGYLMPAYITRLIPIVFVFLLRSVNLSLATIQALFYLILIYSGLVGFYILSNEIFKNSNKVKFISFFSAVFYFFNLYSQSQIFGRFLYSSVALWSLVPIFLFCFIKWVDTAKLKWLVCLIIAGNLYSLAFSQPAHVFALWTPPFVWVLVKTFESKKERARIIGLFLAAVSLWVIFSLWWIYPYFRLGTLAFGQKLSAESNFSSLVGVSQYFSTGEIILLRQSFLFGPASGTFDFYSSNWIHLASVIVFILVLAGMAKLKKINGWLFILVTFFVGWFISKGSNPPLGKAFFEFLFSNFGFTQSLRNSYEKFGLVFLIPYSLLFGAGLALISSKFKTLFRTSLILIVIFISCVFLVWPIWNGDIFTKSLHVNIPSYYEEANAYLNKKEDDGRVLQLPMIGGDSVGYDWGYRGIEPAEFLFDRPSVSKILRAKYFDDKYLSLYQEFTSKKDYSKQLEEMNIRYLILHNDLVSEASGASSSAEVKEILSRNPKIRLLKNFEGLIIYEYFGNASPGIFVAEGGTSLPILGYQRTGATSYTINIKNASSPFKLVFRETYSDLWEAKIDGQKIEKHFLVYDYANGWEIDKTGDYGIEIVFNVWPWD